jgi:hypothetical protein
MFLRHIANQPPDYILSLTNTAVFMFGTEGTAELTPRGVHITKPCLIHVSVWSGSFGIVSPPK